MSKEEPKTDLGFLTLADGHEGGFVPAQTRPDGPMIGLSMRRGDRHTIVPDGSDLPGVSEHLANTLVENGIGKIINKREKNALDKAGDTPAEVLTTPVAALDSVDNKAKG